MSAAKILPPTGQLAAFYSLSILKQFQLEKLSEAAAASGVASGRFSELFAGRKAICFSMHETFFQTALTDMSNILISFNFQFLPGSRASSGG